MSTTAQGLHDHSARKHALLSASAAYRWMACPGSALLTADMPDVETPFAADGTTAHEIAEAKLRHHFEGAKEPVILPEQETIAEEVQPYVDRVIEDFNFLNSKDHDTDIFFETQVDFSKWVPGAYGPADCIIISGDTIHVRDLKFGKGVRVSAKGNPQARCYALGALVMFRDIYDINKIVVEIDHPRLDGLDSEEITVGELLTWANTILKPAADKALNGNAEYHAGTHCRFCKAYATCKTRANTYLQLDPIMKANPEVDLLTDSQVGQILTQAEGIATWVEGLKAYAMRQIGNGCPISGWKVVEGVSRRTWKDDLIVAEKLRAAGYDEAAIYTKKLLGISGVEKLLGKKQTKELLSDQIVKPEGKPTLVPMSDKRDAFKASAADDFKDVDTSEGE